MFLFFNIKNRNKRFSLRFEGFFFFFILIPEMVKIQIVSNLELPGCLES